MQINHTISNILQALNTEGLSTATVAKELQGISDKSLRHALKQAGYEFSNRKPKGWHYIGTDPEPLTQQITDYLPAKPTTSDSNQKKQISHDIHNQFTQEEVTDLLHMLQEWRQQTSVQQEQQPTPLSQNVHERIKALPANDKVRKTIVIDQHIGNQLDEYCKTEKVNKSDIIHLALLDFLHSKK